MRTIHLIVIMTLCPLLSWAQQTHSVTVAINQGKPCTDVLEVGIREPLVSIYPNPSKNLLNIEFKGSSATVSLMDLSGRLLARHTLEKGKIALDIRSIPEGMYVVRIQDSLEVHVSKIRIVR